MYGLNHTPSIRGFEVTHTFCHKPLLGAMDMTSGNVRTRLTLHRMLTAGVRNPLLWKYSTMFLSGGWGAPSTGTQLSTQHGVEKTELLLKLHLWASPARLLGS